MESFLSVFAQKGFQIQFDNGYEVSVMFGRGNYCQHQHTLKESMQEPRSLHRSSDCEVAVFFGSEFVTGRFSSIRHKVDPQGAVAGWVTADEIAALIAEVSAYKTQNSQMERVTITVEDSLDFLHWEVVRLDGEPIGVISKNTEVDSDFGFRAFDLPSWPAKMAYNESFCGSSPTLIGAHNLAQTYANHLIATGKQVWL